MDSERLLRIAEKVAAKQKLKRDLKWWGDPCHDPTPEQAPQFWRKDIPDPVYLAIQNDKNASTIKWHAPDLEEEREAFERTARKLNLNAEELIQSAANGGLIEIHQDMRSSLENTDSWNVESMEEVEFLAGTYDRDLTSIMKAIGEGKSLPAPIVFVQDTGAPYLIAGNTRMMAAKALGESPKVFCFSQSSGNQDHADYPMKEMQGSPPINQYLMDY